MAGHKDEILIQSTFGVPLEIVLGVKRFAVFIDAEQRHVQIVPGIGEVVGVAAEKGNLLLGREDEADIGVLFVAIEPVFPALIQGDDVGAQTGLLLAVAFNLGDHGAAEGELFLRGLRRLDGRAHQRSDIFH